MMSTDKIKTAPFNPVDHMQSDADMIDFIVDCYDDDAEGRTYLSACQFLDDSRGHAKAFEILFRATKAIESRNLQPMSETGFDRGTTDEEP